MFLRLPGEFEKHGQGGPIAQENFRYVIHYEKGMSGQFPRRFGWRPSSPAASGCWRPCRCG
jgi:hypothetical protein